MGDPNFDRTVTFICEHNEDGALGLVVNRPLGMKLSDVLGQMSLGGNAEQLDEVPILRGGPVQPERGFVVHDQLGEWSSTMEVSEGIHVTTSRDILEAMAGGSGPEHALVILGYAGWAAGQLENEMIVNAWLTVPADKDVLFAMPFEKRCDERHPGPGLRFWPSQNRCRSWWKQYRSGGTTGNDSLPSQPAGLGKAGRPGGRVETRSTRGWAAL